MLDTKHIKRKRVKNYENKKKRKNILIHNFKMEVNKLIIKNKVNNSYFIIKLFTSSIQKSVHIFISYFH
jgi:hypothetical protein